MESNKGRSMAKATTSCGLLCTALYAALAMVGLSASRLAALTLPMLLCRHLRLRPIIRVTFEDPRGTGRNTYKVAHLDGSKCSPPVQAPSKPVLHLSVFRRNPTRGRNPASPEPSTTEQEALVFCRSDADKVAFDCDATYQVCLYPQDELQSRSIAKQLLSFA